ncbi:MAG TPA: thermonuclease family protein [Euzebyales bacterium]|nr:thermonuclease family protein [Euzebyales bacterium]
MGAQLRRLIVAALVVVAALWLGSLRRSGQIPAGDPMAGAPSNVQAARVTRVVDGDTLRVEVTGPGRLPGGEHRVRLLAIDSPELDDGAGPECGASAAAAYLRDRVPAGSRVWLEADRQDVDRFDRPLRYVWTTGDALLNLAVVEAGHARAVLIAPNNRYSTAMRDAEDVARAAGAGVWSACAGA